MNERYYYAARGADGRAVQGCVEATCERSALASLRARALVVTSLEPSGSARASLSALRAMGAVKPFARIAFFRSLATLLAAGVGMQRALDVSVQECVDSRLREALASVAGAVQGGSQLSAAMARHPREFARLVVAMVRAGEAGGMLDAVLERVALLLERERRVRGTFVSALAYPAFVAATAVALVGVLLTTVVPTFSSMYRELGVPLPASTRALLALSVAVRSPFVALCATAAGAVFAVLAGRLLRCETGAHLADRWRLHLPLLGVGHRKAVLARIARMLGSLLHCGVAIVDALDVVAEVTQSVVYGRSLRAVALALRHGWNVTGALASEGLYDPLLLQMVQVGEETGSLDALLTRVAEYYEDDVDAALSRIRSLLEPATMLVLGAVVALIVSSLFVPLYSMIGNIK